ncbi:MAG TPA: trypsin-like peptidase domain-containing protein [Gammaproteobacteria bacterium]
MRFRDGLAFVFQAVTIGLALAFVVLVLKPELLPNLRPVVELVQREPTPASAPAASSPRSYADAVTQSAPAVVNIHTAKLVTEQPHPLLEDPTFRRFFGESLEEPQQRLETNLGSGVLVSSEGHLLTNNHVVYGADRIRVQLADGRIAAATLVGSDPESDLAVLRIDLPDLPAATIGASDTLRVGDVVLAIGNPFGVGQTVTMGIVSAIGRSQLGISALENFIQTDAAINPGNSGGALVNANGDLVGINTAIFSRSGGSQGIGFAIPMSLASAILEQIIERGRVVRGWLGVEIQNLDAELATSLGLERAAGIVVAGVLREGPADQAGLRPGDVITAIGGEPVDDGQAAQRMIFRIAPGDAVKVSGWREGVAAEWLVTAAERPQPGG